MAGCAHPATARPDQGHSATEQDQLNQDTHATPPRRHGKNSRLTFPLVRSSRGNFGLVEAQSCDDEFDHATCVVAGGSLPGASGEASSQTHLAWFAERSTRPDRSRSRTTPPNAPARLGRHVRGRWRSSGLLPGVVATPLCRQSLGYAHGFLMLSHRRRISVIAADTTSSASCGSPLAKTTSRDNG